MKTRTLLTGLLALALCMTMVPGCKSFMKYKYGLHQPREETPESLMAFLGKNRYPSENIFVFADSGSYFGAFRDSLFRSNLFSHMIFNRRGELLRRDTGMCQWAGGPVVRSLHPDSSYSLTPGMKLENVLRLIRPISRSSTRDSLIADPDFTMVVIWAKFMGTYNYRLFDLDTCVTANKTARIKVIWLSMDIQKSWHLTRKRMLTTI
jgi:hypothetical protein